MHSTTTRARVNERLARAARFPVTVIIAPAGFGKSVALRDFIRSSRPDAVRLDLRREDAALLAFVRALSEALSPVAPTAIAAFPSLQERVLASTAPVGELSDWLSEHLKDFSGTIAIDDLHHASSDLASIALLADLVERTSERIMWILAARSDAGLPLASWIGYGRMDVPVGEDDLRFTAEEALATAHDSEIAIDSADVEKLRRLTEGWPVALTIALRTRISTRDLPSAASGAREIVYRYLAEQIIARLTPLQRGFLLASSVFSSFDLSIGEQLGAHAEFLAQLRRDVTFLAEPSPGEYRYHDLFRDFLESELRRGGTALWRAALIKGAEILEARHNESGALLLYARAEATDAIVCVIERSGLSLFEQGEGETLRVAIATLNEESQRRHAIVLGVRAMLEAGRGHFEVAQPLFVAAIDAAGDSDSRLKLVHRYAVELVRQGRDCIPLLEPYAKDTALPGRLQLPILGTLATAYAGRGELEAATATIDRALKLSDGHEPDDVLARLYQQAAYVYQFTQTAKARKYAELAIESALRRSLYDVAARACSVLYAILYNETSDPIGMLQILDKLGEYARKGGSEQTRLYGLIASYDIEVERGDDRALETLENDLAQSRAALPRASNEMLLPARALREMWSGNFREAFEMLQIAAAQSESDEARAVTSAHMALCATAAGMPAEAQASLDQAAAFVAKGAGGSLQLIRGQLFLALAELLRGHIGDGHRRLSAAERALNPKMSQLRAFVQAVRTAYRVNLGQAEEPEWKNALEHLRAVHSGGIARMLEALPRPAAQAEGYGALTPAERQILQLLALGASTKEVALRTGRSPQTVDTHIRSVCRKLRCSGRREAVALATRHGWVGT